MDCTPVLRDIKTDEQQLFVGMLNATINCAKQQKAIVCMGEFSKWNLAQLDKIVLPEMNELLKYAIEQKVLFKYGEKQRLLESSYLLTDSLEKLDSTPLGVRIRELQKLYNSL